MQDLDYATAERESKRLSKQRIKEARRGQPKIFPNQKYSMENLAVKKPNKVEG